MGRGGGAAASVGNLAWLGDAVQVRVRQWVVGCTAAAVRGNHHDVGAGWSLPAPRGRGCPWAPWSRPAGPEQWACLQGERAAQEAWELVQGAVLPADGWPGSCMRRERLGGRTLQVRGARVARAQTHSARP